MFLGFDLGMSTEQKKMDASVVFQTYHNEQGEYDPFARLRQDIESVDIATDTMQFRSAPFMGLVDLAYTALFVYFFKPFFSTLLSEAAKDSYPRIKKGARELWGKVFGSTNTPQESLLTADGPKTTKFSIKFSLWATINEGRVKLLFPVECGQKEFERATELFLDLMMSYHAGIRASAIVVG